MLAHDTNKQTVMWEGWMSELNFVSPKRKRIFLGKQKVSYHALGKSQGKQEMSSRKKKKYILPCKKKKIPTLT